MAMDDLAKHFLTFAHFPSKTVQRLTSYHDHRLLKLKELHLSLQSLVYGHTMLNTPDLI